MLVPILRRLYSTAPPKPKFAKKMAPGALAARTASTPLAVRDRRYQESAEEIPRGETDATPEGLTPSQYARFLRLVRIGRIPRSKTPAEWIARENAKRARIRGTVVTTVGRRKTKVDIVGQPIYLPNIVFTLVHNYTPAGEPYNPYEATFRVPLSVTKTDVRSYLHAVYGLETTYIRTDIYRPQEPKRGREQTQSAYKRAVVGLVKPFVYPNRMEDMLEQEREQFMEKLDEDHLISENRKEQRLMIVEQTWPKQPETKIKNPPLGRDRILALVAERRAAREGLVAKTVQDWKEKRARGEYITLERQPKPDQVESE